MGSGGELAQVQHRAPISFLSYTVISNLTVKLLQECLFRCFIACAIRVLFGIRSLAGFQVCFQYIT